MTSVQSPVPVAAPTTVGRSRQGNKDQSNLFAGKKLENANLEIFSTDVLMEGELSKKGAVGWQTWKNRVFVLRGQELNYYTVENGERYGTLKGSMNVKGAKLERLEGNMFSITLSSGSTRVLTAPNIQALMDWMTAISVASGAVTMDPTSDTSLVDHSRNTRIILIRHGHYTSSQTPSVDVNGPLTELGVEQSRRTGRFLVDYLNARYVFKRFPRLPVYHSGVRRSLETAQIIAECFPNGGGELRENKLIREAWPGNPLPSTNRKILAREKLDNMVSDCSRLKLVYRTMFRHLIPGDISVREMPLSEKDKHEFQSAFNSKTSSTRIGDRYRVVVCHANIIRWFICKALGVNPDGTWGRMRYNHCGITVMEIDSVGNVQLDFVNQIGHLDTPLQTETS